ncbi:MAG TPA: hypothetical protein VFD43_01430, partial [Planctomycetota bacterium]|nr:hypothetical protein [Planctomycetota bacterium]
MAERDSSKPERHGGARSAALLMVVLLGAAGWIADAGSARGSAVAVRAAGSFWSVRDRDERVLELPVEGAGLPLRPGQVLWLDAEAAGGGPFTDVVFRLAPGGGQSAYVDLRFGDPGSANHRVVFLPSQPPAGFIAVRNGAGPWTELARGLAGDGLAAEPGAPGELGLRLLPAAIEVSWNGLPLARAATPAAPGAERLALWADDARLLAVRASGSGFAVSDDFSSRAGDARRQQRHRAALAWAAAVVLAALYLRSRCTGRPPVGSLLHATLLWLAAPSLPFALSLLPPLPGIDPRVAAAVLALPGLLLALWSLRAFGALGLARAEAASG